MDKFGGAFSQAKAYAEKGRTHVNAGLSKVDNQWQANRQRSGSNAQDAADPTPHAAAAPPPPPPSRGTSIVPRTTSTTSTAATGAVAGGGGGVFTNMSQQEKQAFFALLDEYFASRPHLQHLFNNNQNNTASSNENDGIPNLSPFPKRGPLQTSSAAAPPPAPPAPPVPAPAPSSVTEWCTALYDYDSTDPDDLSFREGDRIKLVEIVSDDWWRGELNGRKGIFPSTYAQRS
ncbi:hypothetical protein JCM3766R1_004886 [Sporobolomyces carnicolor]